MATNIHGNGRDRPLRQCKGNVFNRKTQLIFVNLQQACRFGLLCICDSNAIPGLQKAHEKYMTGLQVIHRGLVLPFSLRFLSI